jgi:hypothetical protein
MRTWMLLLSNLAVSSFLAIANGCGGPSKEGDAYVEAASVEKIQPLSSSTGPYYYIRAKHSDKCLHQHGGTFGNGDPITQWDCVDEYNVQWELEPSPEHGYYFIKTRHSGKCAHQHGATYANGDRITQWDCINEGNVKWRLIPAPHDYFFIQVQHSGKCLHVHGGGWENGAPITQWDCINQPNVLWWFDPVGH